MKTYCHLRYSIAAMTFVFQFFGLMPLIACQCPHYHSKFIKRLNKSEFVGYVEVIGYDTAKNHDFDRSFTILKILKQFRGNYKSDTISVLDGGDVECTHSLHYPIGTRFIIKGKIESRKEYEFDLVDTPISTNNVRISDPVLSLSICSETLVRVNGDYVTGYITIDKLKASKPQTLNLNEVIRMIESKIRS